MADRTEPISSATVPDVTAVRWARAGLLLAAAGALFVVLDPFGLAWVGLVLGLLGAALAAILCWGERWYFVLLGGAILAVFAWLIAGPHQSIGGWLAVIAAITVLVGAALSYPMEEE
jgi:hypothetical protein